MTIDEVKRKIQEFFADGTLTIVGSGLSAAEGIPGMGGLAAELRSKVPSQLTTANDINNWHKIEGLLSTHGLEEALLQEKPTESVENAIRHATAAFITTHEQAIIAEVIAGRKLRFTDYLEKFTLRGAGITVISTNYDRLIEISAECRGARVDTQFIGRYLAIFSPRASKSTFISGITKKGRAEYSPRVTVLKPHGCLSWYLINGEPRSIPFAINAERMIITPGANKFAAGYEIPFDQQRASANEAIDKSLKYVIIGYGFADDHLQTHLSREMRRKSSIIFTRELSQKAKDIIHTCSDVIGIECTGSGSRVITKSEEAIFDTVNLWDIREMIKEVF